MIDYSVIVPQQQPYRTLCADRDSGRLSHCYLLAGKDAALAFKCVETFVASLYCKEVCKQCAACRKVFNRSHSDIHWFGGKILAAEVDAIVDATLTRASDGKYRIVVVADFHNIDPRMQSKLLKTLEEPGEDTYYFLIAGSTANVIETVLSRCRVLAFNPIGQEGVRRLLQAAGYSGADADTAAALYDSDAERAERFCSDPSYRALLPLSLRISEAASSAAVAKLSREMTSCADMSELLHVLYAVVRDEALVSFGEGKESGLLLKSVKNDIIRIGQALPPRAAAGFFRFIDNALMRLKFNGNPDSVADELLMKFMEARALCR